MTLPTESLRVIMQTALERLNRDAVATLEMGMLRSAFLLSRDRPRRRKINAAIVQMMQQAAGAGPGPPPPAPSPSGAPPAAPRPTAEGDASLQELTRQITEDLLAIMELAKNGPEGAKGKALCKRFNDNSLALQQRMRSQS